MTRIGSFIVGKEFTGNFRDVVDGVDVVFSGWIFDEVGDSALACHRREFTMDDVELVGILLHFFWLKGSSSNPTLLF